MSRLTKETEWRCVGVERLATLEVKAAMLDEALGIVKLYRKWDSASGHTKTCTCRSCYADELIARADELARKTNGS